MAEETKPDEKPVETPKEEPKDDGYDYQKDHNRDIRAIAKEPVIETPKEEGKNDTVDDDVESEDKSKEKSKDDTQPVLNPLDEAKKYLAEQRKAAEDAAKEAAKHSVKEEITRTKEEEARVAKEKDDLTPVWEKENRAPKDYGEIAAETRRIAKLEYRMEARAEKEAEKQAETVRVAAEAKTATEQMESTQSRIGRDMRDLYEGGYLPEIKTPGDPNDPGEKAKDALFKLGIEHNLALKAAGKDPEPSIAKIFFMNKEKVVAPIVQPAGADAPVSGAKPVTPKAEDTGYNYARDHNKSFRQLQEEARRRG